MKKILKFFLVLIFLIGAFIIFYQEILTSYAKFFSVDNAQKGADGILILAGNSSTRTLRAIELLKNGYAKNILVTTPKNGLTKDKDLIKFYNYDNDIILNNSYFYPRKYISNLIDNNTANNFSLNGNDINIFSDSTKIKKSSEIYNLN